MALTDESSGNFVATMPMQPMYGGYGGGYGGGLFGGNGDDWMGILFLIALLNGGFGGWGMGIGGMMWPMMMGGMGAGCGIDYLYPWLNNSQNINDGFRDQMLGTQINGIGDKITAGFGDVQLGIAGVNQNICQTGNTIAGAVRDGFSSAEIAANGRQMASMQQGFALQSGIADLKFTEATEACATRTASATNTRDIIDNQARVGQAILDKLCALELASSRRETEDERRENANLRSENQYLRNEASRVAQTAVFQQGLNAEVDALYNRLKNCPVNTVPVAGSTPLFSCNPSFNNGGCGCGCGGFGG